MEPWLLLHICLLGVDDHRPAMLERRRLVDEIARAFGPPPWERQP